MIKEMASDVKWLNEHAPKTSDKTHWQTVEADPKGTDGGVVVACIHYCDKTQRPVFARIGIRVDTDWFPSSTFNYIFTGKTWRGVD